MLTLDGFIDALKEGGSDASAGFNSLILGGVDGMPTTHQIGFGNAWRHGLYPTQVDMTWVNNNTHTRMLIVVGGAYVTSAMAPIPLLSLAVGGLTFYEIRELYLDWVAGFEAAQYLPREYFLEFPPIRSMRRVTFISR